MWSVVRQQQGYWQARLTGESGLEQTICDGFLSLQQAPDRLSHHFGGRYENIYIDADRLPALAPVIAGLRHTAAQILERPSKDLKLGFWFNAMAPGDITSLHTHDDDDELLAAVLYLATPAGSGDLLLHLEDTCRKVTPRAGMAVFFPPDLPHEVTRNDSDDLRLSLALNIGLRQPHSDSM